jgi:3-dehydroquinate dehydratase-2
MTRVLVINGPNLNLSGCRETDVYGEKTLEEINSELTRLGKEINIETEFMQSSHEGEIIDKIHSAKESCDVIIINPGAYTHYSYAIRDAIKAVGIPVIEVHMSNIYSREEFRSKSVIAPVCAGQISGFGYRSYLVALRAAVLLCD